MKREAWWSTPQVYIRRLSISVGFNPRSIETPQNQSYEPLQIVTTALPVLVHARSAIGFVSSSRLFPSLQSISITLVTKQDIKIGWLGVGSIDSYSIWVLCNLWRNASSLDHERDVVCIPDSLSQFSTAPRRKEAGFIHVTQRSRTLFILGILS